MGTHIECFLPKIKEYSLEEVSNKLIKISRELEKRSIKFNVFRLQKIPLNGSEPSYLMGKNNEFSIDIYDKLIVISSIERFTALYDETWEAHGKLWIVFSAIAKEFDIDNYILAKGGMGDTDKVSDLAYYNGIDFKELTIELENEQGSPATNLLELRDKIWYLNDSSNKNIT